MDPLSTTASIIAVIQLSSDVIKYISDAAGATKDRIRLRKEVLGCESILQELRDDADDSEEGRKWSDTIKALEAPGGPLGRLLVALNAIKTKLRPKEGVGKTLAALKWPFQEKDVNRIIGAIEREKTLLSLALANDCRKLMQDIKKSAGKNGEQLAKLIDSVKGASNSTQTRFSELEDSLTRVHGSQAGIKEGIDRLRNRHDDSQSAEERKEILGWLTPVDYVAQQNDFLARRQPGTGQWLLDSTEFKEWVANGNQTLFCPGIPGAGKTILTSIIVEELADRFWDDEGIGIAYVYCNFRRKDDQKADDLLASLLKQLTQRGPSFLERLRSLYYKHKGRRTRPSLDEISGTLQAVATTYSRVFVIIDALDECQSSDGHRAKFLSELFDLQTKCGVSLFATSRYIAEITEKFEGSMSLEIRASDQDVQRYVEGHLSLLPSFVERNAELQEDISTHIVRAVDGMYVAPSDLIWKLAKFPRFLLAQLDLDSLISKRSPKALRAALATLRTGCNAYDYAYNDAMKRIEGQVADQEELAMQVLAWITCALRPLSALELQHALAVELGEPNLDEENLPLIDDMISACAGLVTVDRESGIIRLVHYTTQEYFQRTQKRWFSNIESEITTICVTYLSFNCFGSGICRSDEEYEKRLESNPFFNYAAHNWGYHASRSMVLGQELKDFLLCQANVEASSQVLRVRNLPGWIGYSEGPSRVTGLHLAAYFGLENAIPFLLHNNYLEAKDSHGRTPLSYAAEKGHGVTVQFLLDSGAVIESADWHGQTPLYWAAMRGQEVVVRLLLDKGADSETKHKYSGRTPTSYAAEQGYEAVVESLLDSGAIIDSKDVSGKTPLSRAVGAGQETVVKLLLDRGADIETKDDCGRTPLSYVTGNWWNVRNRQGAVARVLLDNNPNIESRSDSGRTPLSWAAETAHVAVVRQLLDGGAAVDAKDSYGRTPLSWAAGNGREAVVLLLLDKGADVEAKDSYGRTPLLHAAKKGHETVVQQLLDKGADTDMKDHYGSTPLSIAARQGHIEAVSLLLDTARVDIDSQNYFGRTPLWYATRYGYSDVAHVLRDSAEKSGISLYEDGLPVEVRSSSADGTSRWCDVCTLGIQKHDDYYECQVCNGGDFNVCLECYKSGGHCLEVDHEGVVKQGI